MADRRLIYEVNLVPDPSIETAFDTWLEGHVSDMLRLPGFVAAVIRKARDPDSGRVQRTVHYEVESDAALESYFRDHAGRMRAEGLDLFGDAYSAERRILDPGHRVARNAPKVCANCHAILIGQYCAACGQRARDRMISLWEMIMEASDLLTSLDSRLWRTLGLLLFRPGRLTANYLQGRRARYIPPLRLFVGLGLIFFFVLALTTRFGDEVEGAGGTGGLFLEIGGDGETPGARVDVVPAGGEQDVGKAVQDLGVILPDDVAKEVESGIARARAARQPGQAGSTAPGTQQPAGEEAAAPAAPAAPAGEEDVCAGARVEVPESMAWFKELLPDERVKEVCRKVVGDHGASFVRALLDNAPIMMIVFLPIMAIIMKLAYLFTGRYFVEHLLFLVHYHAAAYLLFILNLATGWLAANTAVPVWSSDLLGIATEFYLPIYLYIAMRVVYRQGRILTALKYVVLAVSYFISLFLMLLITAAVTALTL